MSTFGTCHGCGERRATPYAFRWPDFLCFECWYARLSPGLQSEVDAERALRDGLEANDTHAIKEHKRNPHRRCVFWPLPLGPQFQPADTAITEGTSEP